MTTDEKRQQRATLIIDMEDAQNDFVYEREVAHACAENLMELAGWLRRSAAIEPSGNDFQIGDLREMDFRSHIKYRESANLDRIVRLVDSLKSHRQKLYNLEMRKQALNTPSTIRIA